MGESGSNPWSINSPTLYPFACPQSKQIGSFSERGLLGLKMVTTKLTSKSPQNVSISFRKQIVLGQENITTYVPEIKLRSNFIKHKPTETYPGRLRMNPSMTIGTQKNQARSLRY